MRKAHRVACLFVGLGLTLFSAACSSSASPNHNAESDSSDSASPTRQPTARTKSTSSPAGSYRVGRAERIYVDTTRGTAAHGGEPATTSRRLPTMVLYPATGSVQQADSVPVMSAPPKRGVWPVIVFAHGSTRSGADYIDTLAWWASAGYVVIAPNFPLSATGTPGGTAYGDYPNQSADETFVLSEALKDNTAPLQLSDHINPLRVGLGGQSFGAITTLGTVAAKCCADMRVRAATEFAGMWLPYPSGADLAQWASKVPVLFVHGDKDPTVPYQADRTFWKHLNSPGGFLTLIGTGHDDGYFGGGTKPLDKFVADATLAFYDQYLKNDPTAHARFLRLVANVGPTVARYDPTR